MKQEKNKCANEQAALDASGSETKKSFIKNTCHSWFKYFEYAKGGILEIQPHGLPDWRLRQCFQGDSPNYLFLFSCLIIHGDMQSRAQMDSMLPTWTYFLEEKAPHEINPNWTCLGVPQSLSTWSASWPMPASSDSRDRKWTILDDVNCKRSTLLVMILWRTSKKAQLLQQS